MTWSTAMWTLLESCHATNHDNFYGILIVDRPSKTMYLAYYSNISVRISINSTHMSDCSHVPMSTNIRNPHLYPQRAVLWFTAKLPPHALRGHPDLTMCCTMLLPTASFCKLTSGRGHPYLTMRCNMLHNADTRGITNCQVQIHW